MKRQKFFFLAFCLAMIAALFAASDTKAQTQNASPELSVAGVRLGERASAQEFIKGFQARIGEDGRPTYYYYNKYANQVMKLTAASFEDRYFITEIEVYRVGKSYTAPHFLADKIGYFKTEKEIFIGYRQSTASAITGIPNVDGKDMVGPKTVVKRLGEPTEKQAEGERETLIYKMPSVEIADETGKKTKYAYMAQFEFNDDKLKRFFLKITPEV